MIFQNLIEATQTVFAAMPCKSIQLPAQFIKVQRDGSEGVLTLENHFFQVGQVGQLRIAHTYSPKINIIAVFFFPEYRYQLPVYSMEFVILGQKPIVALMDTVCLFRAMSISDMVNYYMTAVHAKYPTILQDNSMPEWFDACRSKREFFIRPHAISEFPMLSEIHLALVGELAKCLPTAGLFDQVHAAIHKSNLENYKNHHSANSPGLRLMNRSFGEAWTQEYLTRYLFG